MNKRRGLVWVSAAATVGLLVSAITMSRSRSQIETQLAEATARQAKMRAELRRLADAPTANTSPSAASTPAPTTAKPATNADPSFPPRSRSPGLLDFARDNPQLWNIFVQSKRAELGRMHLPFLLRMNLTPQQQERFKDILAAHIARGSDIGAAAHAQGLSHDDPAIKALNEESEKRRKQELADLLGPAGFREFENFERALAVRGYVDGLAMQLAATAPLTAQQSDQLERALAEASEAYRNGKHADPKAVDWAAADRRAREILTTRQFEVWQQGTAHNPFGGSRRAQELTAAYERAVKRMKESEGAAIR